MITTPSALSQTDTFALADAHYASLVSRLQTKATQGLEHGEVEQMINKDGTELLRLLFQSHLDLRYEKNPLRRM